MIAALAYLQYHSVKNQVLQRLRRLKQPKYLVGAIVGGLYFYWYFFRVLFQGAGRGRGAGFSSGMPVDPVFYESIAALFLLAIVLLAWVIPHKRAALTFTEAEVAFLFPAPISRRGLIHFKLLRSQLGILFTVLFLTLLSGGFANGRWLIRAGGWWVILFTLNLHFLASSFALTKLMDRGISTWKRRLTIITLVAAVAGGVIYWVMRELPRLSQENLASAGAAMDYFDLALVSGPLPYLLLPFRLVVQPYLAPDWSAFLLAIGPAIALMVLHYVWVVRADVAFEEASVDASRRLAEKITAARSGKGAGASQNFRARRAPFVLNAQGSPVMALLWKNLISAGRLFTLRTWIIIMVAVGIALFATRDVRSEGGNWMSVIGLMAAMLAFWALLIGPQMVRQDLRQDLPNADLLKLFPLSGWQLALGEILAPAVILTGVHWLLLLVTALCAGPLVEEKLSRPMIAALACGIAMILPALNVISLLIPNSAVVLFPSWFQAGKDAPQGIEATGQRLIFALGQFLAFLLALIPAGVVAAGTYFAITWVVGVPALAVLFAALTATLTLALEAALGLVLLGRMFERLDLSAEQGG